ncbi:MAG: OmpH family outer membrane protein [Verrucomicrobiota bacterium]
MKALLFTTAILLLTAVSGFAQNGNVALIDINKISIDLGVNADIQRQITELNTDLQAELKKSFETLQSQFDEKKKAYGDNPTAEQTAELNKLSAELTGQFQSLQNEANRTAAAKRNELIAGYREQIKPLALAEAKKIGCTVVLPSVVPLYYDESADITAATLKAAIAAGMEVKAPAAE